MAQLAQAIFNGAQIGLVYALMAVGVTIVWGLMEMVNFAHGDLMMWGMMGAWILAEALHIDPLITMIPLAIVGFGFGAVVYRVLMRRVQGGDVFTQMFATFGLLLFLESSAAAAFSSNYHFLNRTFIDDLFGGSLRAGPFVLGTAELFGGVIALAIFVVLYLVVTRTEMGVALQATSEDREAAALIGIDPGRMYAIAWGVGTALAVAAGVILSNFLAIFPTVGFQFTLLVYAIVAMGGFGSIPGTLVAAVLVGILESVTALYLPPAFKDAFVFLAYLLLGLFRPRGLFGRF